MKTSKNTGPNVYADLGMPDADEMLVKAQLATRIAQIIKQGKLTQVLAAERLGMAQPRLSDMLRGKFRGISETKMMACLTRLGSDVEIVVRPLRRAKTAGQISVTFARVRPRASATPATHRPARTASRATAALRLRERAPAYRAGGRKKA